jgi:hypothetical protein
MKHGFLQKWLPIILLGSLGMFLSEFLIWNSMLQIVTGHIPLTSIAITRAILMTTIMYIVLFAVSADIIQRFKISDAASMLILGSIYGLVLEGIFANKVFEQAGFGPEIFGVLLVHLSFTGLSWHPIIDFLFGFFIFKWLLKGRINLGKGGISFKGYIVLATFGIFWFIWPYAKWYPKLPHGLPLLALEALQLLFPIILFGILFYLVFRKKIDYVPETILGTKAYLAIVAYILFFAVRRYILLPNKAAFIFFCSVLLFYAALLALYLKFGRAKMESTAYSEGFPIDARFSFPKYIKISGFLFLLYFIFKYAAAALHFEPLLLALTTILSLAMVLAAVAIPVFAIFKIIKGVAA